VVERDIPVVAEMEECVVQHLWWRWWRWVGIVVVFVLIGTTVVSVGHLMIVKRFEIEKKDRDMRFPTTCIKV
jgi:predicted anti-sigma-YlaC factor YlaD